MIERKTWKEFGEAGMLWFVNMILHTFGWSIVLDIPDDGPVEVYPARVRFRGFSEESNAKGYSKVANYLKENIDSIIKDGEE